MFTLSVIQAKTTEKLQQNAKFSFFHPWVLSRNPCIQILLGNKMNFEIKAQNQELTVNIKIETDRWFETFPVYLNTLRAAGYGIPEGTMIYLPGKLIEEMNKNDRELSDFMLFDSDFAE
jgi:hypothetical protein